MDGEEVARIRRPCDGISGRSGEYAEKHVVWYRSSGINVDCYNLEYDTECYLHSTCLLVGRHLRWYCVKILY